MPRYKDRESGEVAFATDLAFAQALSRCKAIADIAKSAVPDIKRGRVVPHSLANISTGQLEAARALIATGVSPQVAACRCFNIHPVTFNRWMEEGSSPQGPIVHRDFYLAIKQAMWDARAIAESRVFIENPEAWLMRSPMTRSTVDEPGWTEETVQKHTDASGAGPVVVKLEFGDLGMVKNKQLKVGEE